MDQGKLIYKKNKTKHKCNLMRKTVITNHDILKYWGLIKVKKESRWCQTDGIISLHFLPGDTNCYNSTAIRVHFITLS